MCRRLAMQRSLHDYQLTKRLKLYTGPTQFDPPPMTRPNFPTDISRAAFEEVRAFLDRAHKSTRPKIHDPYDVFCAILFLMRKNLPWRSLPDSFPPWRTVHHHFIQWTTTAEAETPLEQSLTQLKLDDVSTTVRGLVNKRPSPPV